MTYFIFSLGCKVNSYECSALASSLRNRGYFEDSENPDVVIINTCSVTATADQKSRQHIRKFKGMYPHAILVVMGCYSQGNAKFVLNDIDADIVVGTSTRNQIPDLIELFRTNHHPIMMIDKNVRTLCYEELGVTSYSENTRAYLKIQDGCNNFCSYCLIPYRRGASRSRQEKDILNEANFLIKKGYQEIVLTGIDISSYGKDLENITFTQLVKDLLALEGLKSLRISSIEAKDMSNELLELYKDNDKLAKHMHIPLQSGSQSVMERMHRKYTKQEYLDKISLLREMCPDIMISTDVIVGFPGETEEEFMETYNFIKECGFHMLHVFPFSSREGTLAFKMKDQINPKIKKERCLKLIELSNKLWDEYCSKFVGQEVEVLVEQYEDGYNIGHTSNYLEVKYPSNKSEVGQIVKVIYKK